MAAAEAARAPRVVAQHEGSRPLELNLRAVGAVVPQLGREGRLAAHEGGALVEQLVRVVLVLIAVGQLAQCSLFLQQWQELAHKSQQFS